eukprot:TRINITY_DN14376_c0_g1_i1.p1 TRINITY_DN14376_c0_g1~~TRINITY_DN14376_c0_g1_i1.p1  ORF type:complete len:2183 (+),score=493.32 TRINITY_DN14376_c0_g1_i1:157-6549(+)
MASGTGSFVVGGESSAPGGAPLSLAGAALGAVQQDAEGGGLLWDEPTAPEVPDSSEWVSSREEDATEARAKLLSEFVAGSFHFPVEADKAVANPMAVDHTAQSEREAVALQPAMSNGELSPLADLPPRNHIQAEPASETNWWGAGESATAVDYGGIEEEQAGWATSTQSAKGAPAGGLDWGAGEGGASGWSLEGGGGAAEEVPGTLFKEDFAAAIPMASGTDLPATVDFQESGFPSEFSLSHLATDGPPHEDVTPVLSSCMPPSLDNAPPLMSAPPVFEEQQAGDALRSPLGDTEQSDGQVKGALGPLSEANVQETPYVLSERPAFEGKGEQQAPNSMLPSEPPLVERLLDTKGKHDGGFGFTESGDPPSEDARRDVGDEEPSYAFSLGEAAKVEPLWDTKATPAAAIQEKGGGLEQVEVSDWPLATDISAEPSAASAPADRATVGSTAVENAAVDTSVGDADQAANGGEGGEVEQSGDSAVWEDQYPGWYWDYQAQEWRATEVPAEEGTSVAAELGGDAAVATEGSGAQEADQESSQAWAGAADETYGEWGQGGAAAAGAVGGGGQESWQGDSGAASFVSQGEVSSSHWEQTAATETIYGGQKWRVGSTGEWELVPPTNGEGGAALLAQTWQDSTSEWQQQQQSEGSLSYAGHWQQTSVAAISAVPTVSAAAAVEVPSAVASVTTVVTSASAAGTAWGQAPIAPSQASSQQPWQPAQAPQGTWQTGGSQEIAARWQPAVTPALMTPSLPATTWAPSPPQPSSAQIPFQPQEFRPQIQSANQFADMNAQSYATYDMASAASYPTSGYPPHQLYPETGQPAGGYASVAAAPPVVGPPRTTAEAMRTSVGRPPCALLCFGFGGKLLVLRPTDPAELWDPKSKQGPGGTLRVENLNQLTSTAVAGALGGSSALSLFFGGASGKRAFSGPLAGGALSTKEVLKWLDERGANCEDEERSVGSNGESMRLLLGMLKCLCQSYGIVRAPLGQVSQFEKEEAAAAASPQTAFAKLLTESAAVSASSAAALGPTNGLAAFNGGQGKLPRLLQGPLASHEIEAPAVQMEAFLMAGRRKDALQVARSAHLWGPALLLARQLNEKIFLDTVAEMAQAQFSAGTPLRTLSLLMAGQQAKVFGGSSTGRGAEGGAGDSSAAQQQLAGATSFAAGESERGLEAMLNEWKGNLAVMTANRTAGDERVILHLGDCLWRVRGEVTSAHVCYVVAGQSVETYSPTSRLCLLGADHWQHPRTFATPEAIQRTEVYEYARILGNPQYVLPAFQPFKLIYAYLLAEAGRMKEARNYCEAVQKALRLSGRSPEIEACRVSASGLEERLKSHMQAEQAGSRSIIRITKTALDWGAGWIIGATATAAASTPPLSTSGMDNSIPMGVPGGLGGGSYPTYGGSSNQLSSVGGGGGSKMSSAHSSASSFGSLSHLASFAGMDTAAHTDALGPSGERQRQQRPPKPITSSSSSQIASYNGSVQRTLSPPGSKPEGPNAFLQPSSQTLNRSGSQEPLFQPLPPPARDAAAFSQPLHAMSNYQPVAQRQLAQQQVQPHSQQPQFGAPTPPLMAPAEDPMAYPPPSVSASDANANGVAPPPSFSTQTDAAKSKPPPYSSQRRSVSGSSSSSKALPSDPVHSNHDNSAGNLLGVGGQEAAGLGKGDAERGGASGLGKVHEEAQAATVPAPAEEQTEEKDDALQERAPARSVSEPNFRRQTKKGAMSTSSGSIATLAASGKQPSRGGLMRSVVGGVGGLFSRAVSSFALRPRGNQAKLGDNNSFYYDEKLKRWVDKNADAESEAAPVGPPPTSLGYTPTSSPLKPAGPSDSPTPPGPPRMDAAGNTASPTSAAEPPLGRSVSAGLPPLGGGAPAARRSSVRSRYVDTFNKGGAASRTAPPSPLVSAPLPHSANSVPNGGKGRPPVALFMPSAPPPTVSFQPDFSQFAPSEDVTTTPASSQDSSSSLMHSQNSSAMEGAANGDAGTTSSATSRVSGHVEGPALFPVPETSNGLHDGPRDYDGGASFGNMHGSSGGFEGGYFDAHRPLHVSSLPSSGSSAAPNLFVPGGEALAASVNTAEGGVQGPFPPSLFPNNMSAFDSSAQPPSASAEMASSALPATAAISYPSEASFSEPSAGMADLQDIDF